MCNNLFRLVDVRFSACRVFFYVDVAGWPADLLRRSLMIVHNCLADDLRKLPCDGVIHLTPRKNEKEKKRRKRHGRCLSKLTVTSTQKEAELILSRAFSFQNATRAHFVSSSQNFSKKEIEKKRMICNTTRSLLQNVQDKTNINCIILNSNLLHCDNILFKHIMLYYDYHSIELQ